jgi:hypothetical protein
MTGQYTENDHHPGDFVNRVLAFGAGVCCLLLAAPLTAQVPGAGDAPPAMTIRAPFAQWRALTTAPQDPNTSLALASSSSGSGKWWGLGVGAAIGAGFGVATAQGLCEGDTDCAGPSLGLALVGALVFGVVGLFIGDAID